MSLFKLESVKLSESDLDNIGITDCDVAEDEDSGNITCSEVSSSQDDSYEISMSLISPISILKKSTHYENENSQDSNENKRVVFDAVDVYYFERAQGFSCVPNQGGSTLGMENIHWRREKLPLNIFQKKRKREKHSILFQLCLEGVLSLTPDQFSYLNHKTKSKPYSDIDSDNESLKIVRDSKDSKEDGEVSCSSSTNSVHSFSSDWNGKSQVYSIPGESDSEEDELESLRSIEDGYFLQPVSIKKRRSLLKRSGVPRIDSNEKLECQEIRDSRLMCGCTCEGACLPETCLCALNGIPCQVDRTCFPCACTTPTHCHNEFGRIKFDPIRARTHYLHTRMRLEMEQTSSSMNSFPGLHKYDETEIIVDNFKINKFQSLKRNRPYDYDQQNDTDVHKKNCRSASSASSEFDSNDFEKGTNYQTLANLSSLEKEENEAFLASYNTTSSGGCRDCQNSRYVNVLIQELANQQRHMREAMSTSSRSPIMNIQSNRVNDCMNFSPNGYELVDQTFSSTQHMHYNCHIYNSFDESSTSYSENDWHVQQHASFGRPRQSEYYRSVNQENVITPSMQMCGESDMVNLEAKENNTEKPMTHEEKSSSSHSVNESIPSTNVTANQDYYAECENEFISSPNVSSELIEYNSFQRKVNESVSCFPDSHSINQQLSSTVVSSTTNPNQLSSKMNSQSFDVFKTDVSHGMSYTQQLMEDFSSTNTQIAEHIPFSTLESTETLDDERFRLLPMSTNSIHCRLEPISCLLNAPNLASKSLSALSGPVHIVPSPTEDPNNNLLATPTSTVSA